jgi:hypothetical protein
MVFPLDHGRWFHGWQSSQTGINSIHPKTQAPNRQMAAFSRQSPWTARSLLPLSAPQPAASGTTPGSIELIFRKKFHPTHRTQAFPENYRTLRHSAMADCVLKYEHPDRTPQKNRADDDRHGFLNG